MNDFEEVHVKLGDVNKVLRKALGDAKVPSREEALVILGHTQKLLKQAVRAAHRAGVGAVYIADQLDLKEDVVEGLIE